MGFSWVEARPDAQSGRDWLGKEWSFTRTYSHVSAHHCIARLPCLPGLIRSSIMSMILACPLSPKTAVFLPDLLHQHGYQTAAFVGSLILDPLDGTAPGFGSRVFDVYDAGFHLRRHGSRSLHHWSSGAAGNGGRSCPGMAEPGGPTKPVFLWVHLYDCA